MRISDWSSDVCSSDLPDHVLALEVHRPKWVFLIRRFQPALCINSCPPFPTSATPRAAPYLLCVHQRWLAIVRAARHHCPDHTRGLIRECDRSDLLRTPLHQLDEPGSFAAVSFGVAYEDRKSTRLKSSH